MIAKRTILGNELIKEIISIRTDTLWKMLAQKKDKSLPGITEEGATVLGKAFVVVSPR